MVGFLGGLTTFSAFGIELLQFLRAGRVDLALLLAAGNLILGVVAAALGWKIGRQML
jgi:CrcB protein